MLTLQGDTLCSIGALCSLAHCSGQPQLRTCFPIEDMLPNDLRGGTLPQQLSLKAEVPHAH